MTTRTAHTALRASATLAGGIGLVLVLSRLGAGAFAAMSDSIDRLGPLGPIVFGIAYVAGTVLLFPGAPMTIAAGALFGPLLGTAIVSAASTIGAGLAFVIARTVARERVERWVEASPRLRATDLAISEGGWRVAALMRLSPIVPFSLQNYVYGLSGARFWPVMLVSWLTMLPGTFLYVYVGHLGAEGVAGDGPSGPGAWALRGVGLAATVAVVVYLTRLSRLQLAAIERADPEENRASGTGTGAELAAAADDDDPEAPSRARTVATVVVGLLLLATGLLLRFA